jgi:phosphoribosylamine--glycine ligase
MKVLVLGQGGREHALVKAFRNSPSVTEVHAIPGNDGIATEALCHKLSLQDSASIIQFCLRTEIDFVFVGPEDPLVQGLADELRGRGILVVGPGKDAALLEGSKIFAKQFMMEAQVPTAAAEVVTSVEQTLQLAEKFTAPYILKADGLAAGKGVFICKTKEELEQAAKSLFVDKSLGVAGTRALLEQNLPGWELSYLVVTNGTDYQVLPLAQDHKRLKDNHQGPNTGGMGTIAPLKLDPKLDKKIRETIIAPSIKHLEMRGLFFRGILFVGVMVTEKGPMVLEYNVRLGDPETQVILPLIENDLGQMFLNLAKGKLETLRYKNLFSSCVILAAEGYPENAVKGSPISGDITYSTPSSYFIHAGTKKEANGQWVTNGGRVLGAVGLGSSLNEAIKNSYELTEKVKWNSMQFRKDIGKYFTSSSEGQQN